MERAKNNLNKTKLFGAALLAFLLAISISANIQLVSAYTPQKGDYFNYSETTTVNNGQGGYTGYTDQLQTTGMERMNSVNGSVVSAFYSYTYQYSNNQGSSTSSSSSGTYTWSLDNFTYVNGTDGQVGFGGIPYSKPLRVWFAMNASLSDGSTFFVLNTRFTIISKNYSFQLPTQNKYVQTIQTEGTGQYQRNDSYGIFTASYSWDEYFDPTTGYIVGYHYVEQDNGNYQGQSASFTYTDDLYITSTSYSLIAASPPTSLTKSLTNQSQSQSQGFSGGFPLYLILLPAGVAVLFVVAIIVYALARRGKERLPEHPYTSYTPPGPPPTPFESKIDLGSKPPEQVVIRDVAKVNCKYCGTLIPTTAETCPYCGGPRQ